MDRLNRERERERETMSDEGDSAVQSVADDGYNCADIYAASSPPTPRRQRQPPTQLPGSVTGQGSARPAYQPRMCPV